MNGNIQKEEIADWFRSLQDRICNQLQDLDGKGRFVEDVWERGGGGGGRSRIIEGELIERGGVNFSAVHGDLPAGGAKALGVDAGSFFASGVSIVLHPVNPMVPIIHMNVRYFEMDNGRWWFGGGIDLTPHYVEPSDARLFHKGLKAICDKHDAGYYTQFKEWADRYFHLKHRSESRGIGGIFFDRLSEPKSRESCFDFVKEVGEAFVPLYQQQVELHREESFGPQELKWQRLRRGRYVEFNLVWDRGTKFGLETGGRTESILMSLPPMATWEYDYQPEEGSREEETLNILRQTNRWLPVDH